MESKQVYKFIEEILQQCRFARIAFSSIQNEIRAMETEKAFFYVHTFLSHASNIAGIFWPVRESSNDRGETLRNELKIADDFARQLREIRSHLEHYDEHFEDWLGTLNEWSYVDMNIMPKGTTEGFKEDAFHRSLDPETFHLEFRGAHYDLKLISDEIKKLEASSNTWLRSNSPW